MTIKNLVTDAEWQARCELAALYRIIAHYRQEKAKYRSRFCKNHQE